MTDSARRRAACMNCGREREMAARGLCFKCYRAEERRAENPWAAADRHNRTKLKAQRKLRTAVTSILNSVDNVIEFMDEEHVETIRGVCGHYLAALASGLPSTSSKGANTVNSEHEDAVNSPLPESGGLANQEHAYRRVEVAPTEAPPTEIAPTEVTFAVNSEQKPSVNRSQPQADGLLCSQEHAVEGTATEGTPDVNSEPKSFVNGSQPLANGKHQRSQQPFVMRSAKPNRPETNLPLVLGKDYEVRPHPQGRFGVYEVGSTVCLQWYADSEEAWDAAMYPGSSEPTDEE